MRNVPVAYRRKGRIVWGHMRFASFGSWIGYMRHYAQHHNPDGSVKL